MKHRIFVLAALFAMVAFAGSAFAVPGGKTKVFETKMGTVNLSSDTHKAKGIGCMDCHKGTFKMAAGSTAMPLPHKAGESCGVCHNGDKVFSVQASCKTCHIK